MCPELVLWCWVVLTLGQVLACLAHWDASPVGGRADIGDCCEQGVLPKVAGLPPGDLIEQVRVGPAWQRCRYEDRVLELLVCLPRNVHSGRNRSRIRSRVSAWAITRTGCVITRSSGRYRHWPVRSCSSPDPRTAPLPWHGGAGGSRGAAAIG